MLRTAVVLVVALSATPVWSEEGTPPTPAPRTPSASAEPPGRARALALHDEAKDLYTEGRYADAIDKLEEAVALDPEATILHYNLGLIEEKRGNLQRAIDHYRTCLDLQPGPAERDDLTRTIKRLEGALAAGAVPEVAPPPAAPPPPPPTAPPPPRTSSPYLPWMVTTGVVAVASFVTAGVLAGVAADLDPGDEARTTFDVGIDELQADAEQAHRLAIGADVMAGLGGLATAATVGLAITSWLEADEDVEIAMSPMRVEVAWRF